MQTGGDGLSGKLLDCELNLCDCSVPVAALDRLAPSTLTRKVF